jgi:hypothetical protein
MLGRPEVFIINRLNIISNSFKIWTKLKKKKNNKIITAVLEIYKINILVYTVDEWSTHYQSFLDFKFISNLSENQ